MCSKPAARTVAACADTGYAVRSAGHAAAGGYNRNAQLKGMVTLWLHTGSIQEE